MRVFVAEKPSLGKAIAAVLPGPQKRHKTHIESGESNVVVWCAGHILEQFLPEDYDPALKKWSLDSLPIEPEEWRMKTATRTKDLYQTIERFAKDATLIVHSGDPDREGQLLVDEVLTQLKVDVQVKRLLINDLNPAAVKRSLSALENNTDYAGLRDAALGRSRADWLYGLNLTRLHTVLGRDSGYDGVLSVGRVQTPVLGLVVRRDLEIEAFVSKPFYTLSALISAPAGEFTAQWVPGPGAAEYQDTEGRVIDAEYTAQCADQLRNGLGEMESVKTQHKREAPPLPFSLPELQKAASLGRGLSPKKTLAVAQSLYEKHQLLTYPRSDCPYLPLDHWNEASEVRDAIAQSVGNGHALQPLTDAADLITRGKCWNDKKITAHHAIIPTKKWTPLAELTDDERWLYEQVALRYLLQFCADREYEQTDVVLSVSSRESPERFKAKGRVEKQAGWTVFKKVLFAGKDEMDSQEESEVRPLPLLAEGEPVQCVACEVVEKKTSPPKRFTEASLLEAMTGIARFVKDPNIRQTLKETDGLGTPATQATIIETLFRRAYLEKQKKQVLSTELGRAMISVLPETATLPDMTARWEQQLAQVEAGAMVLEAFMLGVVETTRELVDQGKSQGAVPMTGLPASSKKTDKISDKPAPQVPCLGTHCDGRMRRIKGSKGFFWGCTNYQGGCKETRPDNRGKPGPAVSASPKGGINARKAYPPAKVGDGCPLCKSGSIQLKALKKGKNAGKNFEGCTGYPACKYFMWSDTHSLEVKKQ